MEINDFLRDPASAAVFAAGVTAGYIYLKAKLNNDPIPPNSELMKPALLVAILVYLIIMNGIGTREAISIDPF